MDVSRAPLLLARADASTELGMGHFVRSLALCEAWRRSGGRAILASHCPLEALRRIAAAAGVPLVSLPKASSPAETLATTQLLIDQQRSAGRGEYPVTVSLDGSHLRQMRYGCLRNQDTRVLLWDDYAPDQRYDCDVLLNPNWGAERLDYERRTSARLLRGTSHLVLRPQFLVRGERRMAPVVARRVLVTMGGSDPTNATALVVEAAGRTLLPLELLVVVGPAHRGLRGLRFLTSADRSIEILVAPSNMRPLMEWADLTITAAGHTCWELASVGTPTAVLSVHALQHAAAQQVAGCGAFEYWGLCAEQTAAGLGQSLSALLQDAARRQTLSARASSLVDGRGADRVVSALWEEAGVPRRMLDFPPAVVEEESNTHQGGRREAA